ncbi:MAG TPA: Fe-S cluster protein [Chloroflexi bacterium]|nr:Fe-S cluster protein [Chloroflexota bacterium]
MLIEEYELEVFTPPCEPGAERFSAIAHLKDDITGVLPYLNATLKGAIYNPAVPALSWTRGGRKVVFSASQIAVSNLRDRDEAIRVLESEIERVNRTWERRDEITPSFHVRKRPTPLAIYRLLPQTNCKKCGEPTCYVFATKLAAGQHRLSDCPPLTAPEYQESLAALQEMLADVAG